MKVTLSASGIVLMLVALCAVGTGAAAAPRKAEQFVEPLFPTRTAPVGWPGNPGTRLEMPAFARKYPPARRCWKIKVTGQSEAEHKRNVMGTYRVGDTVRFSGMIGDTDSEFFGSVKDGRDGGKWVGEISWMDDAGRKVLATDTSLVRLSCATCAGFWSFYFNIPTTARTGRHRLHMSYVNTRLGMEVHRDLFFHVVNDGSWAACPQLDAAKVKYPSVVVLQQGRACEQLSINSYAGVQDTHMIAVHRVPDRRADHCNFGGVVQMRIGTYGQDLRGLIAFDLNNVPDDAEVAEAHLQLYTWQFLGRQRPGAATKVTAYEVLKPWGGGVGNGSRYARPVIRKGEASWQCSSYPTEWAEWGCEAPGVDRSAEPVGSSAKTATKAWVSIPLDAAMVTRWVRAPKTNHGVLLLGAGYAGSYHSSEYEDPAMRPRLILAFRKPIKPVPTECSPDGRCPLPKAAARGAGADPPANRQARGG